MKYAKREKFVTIEKVKVIPDRLWHTAQANFYGDQPERFEFDTPNAPDSDGIMFWCDSYLEAVFLAEAFKKLYKSKCWIGIDDIEGFEWVLIATNTPTETALKKGK